MTRGIQEKLQEGRRWMKEKLMHKGAGHTEDIAVLLCCIAAILCLLLIKVLLKR